MNDTQAPILARLAYPLYWALSLVVFLSDQVTKQLVEARIPFHSKTPVIRGWFDLTHTTNTGAAFGMFSDSPAPWKTALLIGVSVGLLGLVVFLLIRHRSLRWELGVGLSLLLGGALGNLLDRIRFGHVVDFLDVHFRQHHWPTFNLADSAITIGAGLLIIDAFRSK